ncbi:serine hydrolase domain-containing protein [Amycolatopsis sp. NBC_01286]|uniref:serine hydrolase domain-containing protein n=1 Tax=Amycolatopsis sp. NBC_01286 TaxID=2903560 RepID=UPI002E128AF9|nr:beta-lactamase family protein [Amycolatopsis sp. NBC_01286]
MVAATIAAAAACALAVTIPASASTSSTPNALQQQVNAVQQTGTVGVAAQVTSPRGQLFAEAGQADIATMSSVQSGDAFRIGSSTKTFVATVMLQLVAEHRVSLEDTVERWLPGLVTGAGNDGSKITVRELLQQTSGVPEYLSDFPEITSTANFQAGRFTTYTAAQLVAIAMRQAPEFAPGTAWEYSNTNYILAGMIIKKATGHTWQHEVTQRIINPLHLSHTIAPITSSAIPGRHLHGYSNFGSGPVIDVTALNPSAADAAGAMISTTDDLTRFFHTLVTGKLLAPAQLTAMETTVPAPGLADVLPGARYGLGLMQIPLTCGGSYYAHGGDLPGYHTREGVTTDGRTTAVAVQTGDGTATTEHAMDNLIDRELCTPATR